MDKNCKICSEKNTKKIIDFVYYCPSCRVVFCEKNYQYKIDFFDDFFDGGFVSQRKNVFKDFFSHNTIRENLKKEMRVIDIGCATGDFIKECSEITNWGLTGIDIVAEAVAIAKEKNPQADFLIGKIEDYTGGLKEKFDIVFCSHTLEHVNNPKEFIESIYSILKKEGILYLEIPNERTNLMLWIQKRFNTDAIHGLYSDHPYGHLFFYGTKSLKTLLKNFCSIDIIFKQFPLITVGKNWKYYTTEKIKKLLFFLAPLFHVSDRIIIIAKK